MNSNPPLYATIFNCPGNQTTITYNLPPLDFNQLYYWRIVAIDNHDATNVSQLWHFTTNQPPYEPSSPSPAYNSTNVSITVDLNWNWWRS